MRARRKSVTMFRAAAVAAMMLAGAGSGAALAGEQSTPTVTVYKSPTCGCCSAWVEHMRAHGFTVETKDVDDISAVKRLLGVPDNLASCHTATVGGYVVEGHVPAADVAAMLSHAPAVRGVAVPGMPATSPGMDVPGATETYPVVAFGADGRQVLIGERGPQ